MRSLSQIVVMTGRVLYNAIHMGLDIFGDVMVEVLPYCTPMNKLHVLEVEKVYWKYILNVLIHSIMNHLKETISIFLGPTVS